MLGQALPGTFPQNHSRGRVRGGRWLRHHLSQKLSCAETALWTAVAKWTKASRQLLFLYLERSRLKPASGPPADRSQKFLEWCVPGV